MHLDCLLFASEEECRVEGESLQSQLTFRISTKSYSRFGKAAILVESNNDSESFLLASLR